MLNNLPIQSIFREVSGLILILYLSVSLLVSLTLIQNALLLGVPLLILFSVLLLKKLLSGFRLYRFLDPAYLYLAFLPVPTIIGFLNRNNFAYLVGDLWQIFLIFLVVFLVVELVRDRRDVEKLFKCIILFCSFDVVLYFMKVGISGYFRTCSLSSMILAIIYFYLLIYSKRRNRWLCGVFLALSLVHLVLTQTRTYWLGALLGAALILLFGRLRVLLKPQVIRGLALVVIILATCIFTGSRTRLADTGFDLSGIVSRRVKSLKATEFTGGLGSFEGRILEGKEIISEFSKSSFVEKLAGKGFGAIYDNPRMELLPEEGPGAPNPHFIHITYLDVLYYQGILGLVLFLGFMIYTLLMSFRTGRRKGLASPDSDINKLSTIIILVFLAISLGANYIWANLIFSLFVGIIYAYRKLGTNPELLCE